MDFENPEGVIRQNNQPVRVKICGLTNLDDALAAADAGADFLGFIFYEKSRRAIKPDEVRTITSVIRSRGMSALLVGVFVNEEIDHITNLLDSCFLDLAQLSGDEPAAYIGDKASALYGRSYKALKPTSLAAARIESERYIAPHRTENVPSLMIDTYHSSLPGGTGQTADWNMAGKLSAEVPRLMLAGGLNPGNLALAISQVNPFAVDVASGVERSPGKKDRKLVSEFITIAHGL